MELNALAEAPAARVGAVDPDAEPIARARANPREFLWLYDRYFDPVLGYARLRVADAATCGGPAVADAAVIHHALTAVTSPTNAILHEKVVGVQNGVPVEAEWWQETSPPYASRVIKGPVGHEGEVTDNGTTAFEYDPGTNTITEQRDSSPPTPIDPVSEVRQELARGQAQVAGTVVPGLQARTTEITIVATRLPCRGM